MTSSPAFDPSCPSGGSWYACGNGAEFVGCCASNPCTDYGCPYSDLRPAAFASSAYGTFPDALCDSGDALFYTCQSPSFLGCCEINPCSSVGCPGSYLVVASLPFNTDDANHYDPQPPLSYTFASGSGTSATTGTTHSTTSSKPTSKPSSASQSSSSIATMTSLASSLTTATTPIPTNSTYPTTSADDSNSSSNTTVIAAGAAVGGAIFLVILILVFWRWHRHMTHSRTEMSTKRATQDLDGLHNRIDYLNNEKIFLSDPTKAIIPPDSDKTDSSHQTPPLPPPPLLPPSQQISDLPSSTYTDTIHEAPTHREHYTSYSPNHPPSEPSLYSTIRHRSFQPWSPMAATLAGRESGQVLGSSWFSVDGPRGSVGGNVGAHGSERKEGGMGLGLVELDAGNVGDGSGKKRESNDVKGEPEARDGVLA